MKTEQDLDNLVAALPRDMQPESDLWQSLEPRLAERKSTSARRMSRLNQMLGMAAALILMLVVGWRVLVVPDDAGSPVAVTGGGIEADAVIADALPPQYAMALQFESLKAEQLAQLTPGSNNLGDWQYQLVSWDQAIDQVSGALNDYPHNVYLLSQMQGLYEQQLDYLRLIGRVDANSYFSGEER